MKQCSASDQHAVTWRQAADSHCILQHALAGMGGLLVVAVADTWWTIDIYTGCVSGVQGWKATASCSICTMELLHTGTASATQQSYKVNPDHSGMHDMKVIGQHGACYCAGSASAHSS